MAKSNGLRVGAALFLAHESGRNDMLNGRRLAKLVRDLQGPSPMEAILALMANGYHETMSGQCVDSLTAEIVLAEANGDFSNKG